MKRAIVLSGGGSKGSYEIGVWKALRRLNIKYDIVYTKNGCKQMINNEDGIKRWEKCI